MTGAARGGGRGGERGDDGRAAWASERVAIAAGRVVPPRADVLRCAGLPSDPGGRTSAILERAFELLASALQPAGILREVSLPEFARIYAGEGRNAPATPLDTIAPRAERLALFAATTGRAVSETIAARFAANDFALATLLDAAASAATERAADAVQEFWAARIHAPALTDRAARPTRSPDERRVLRYSPGYCGWDLTGQRALFAALAPEAIGIHLRESCLMEPLKSISGVIVAGPPEIHVCADDFAFCRDCRTHGCRERARGC